MTRAGRIAALVLGLIALLSAVSLVATPHPVDVVDIASRFAAPSLSHPLGTDQYGRDVLSMLMAGGATSLGVAASAVALGLLGGVPLGLAAALGARPVSLAVRRASDLVFAFPALIVAAILAALTAPSGTNAAIAIGVFNVPVFARLSAAAARRVAALEFVAVARLSGKGGARIALEHVLPNIAPVIVTQATTQLAIAMLAEAGLSYVGLGAQPPAVSWGRMLAEAQTLVMLAPQLAVWPGLALTLAVFSITTVGEALRRGLDPRVAPEPAGESV